MAMIAVAAVVAGLVLEAVGVGIPRRACGNLNLLWAASRSSVRGMFRDAAGPSSEDVRREARDEERASEERSIQGRRIGDSPRTGGVRML